MSRSTQPSASLLRVIIDRMPDPVVITRQRDATIVYVNRAFEQACRIRAQDAYGLTTSQLGVYTNLADRESMRRRLVQGQPVYRHLTLMRTVHGEERYHLIDAELIEQDGEVMVFSLVRDVHDEHSLRLQLDATERLLTAVGEASGLSIWDTDLKTSWMRLHEAGLLRELPLQERLAAIHPEDIQRMRSLYEHALRTCAPSFEHIYRLPSPLGDRFIETRARFVRDAAGVPVRMVGLDLDVTESQTTLMALRQTRSLLNHLLDAANVMVVGLDEHGVIHIFNGTAEQITGYSAEQVIGQSCFEALVPKMCYPRAAQVFFEQAGEERHHYEVEHPILTREGEERPILWRTSWHRPANQSAILIAFGHDLSVQRSTEQVQRRLAYTDEVTGLANLRALKERLAQGEVAPGGVQTLLLIQLEDYPRLIDLHEEAMLTGLLSSFAERFVGLTGPHDLIARVAPDTFAWYSPRPGDRTRALAVAQVQAALKAPASLHGAPFYWQVSIGSAQVKAPLKPELLLGRARLALQQARAAGGQRAMGYETQLDKRARLRAVQIFSLDRVLRADELGIAWQPIIDLRTGVMVGVEALARWQEDGEEISPEVFIPLAEESGRIHALGRRMLARSCALAQQWQAAGLPFGRIALNVSALELREPGYPEGFMEIVRSFDLSPDRLGLELTESSVVRPGDVIHQNLQRLSALGVELSLDDFGTGFSSLRVLRSLPLHRMKIAQEFIIALRSPQIPPQEGADRAIIEAALQLARALGLQVVAEGISDDILRRALLGLGCAFGQGNGLSVPLSTAAFEDFLRAGARVPAIEGV